MTPSNELSNNSMHTEHADLKIDDLKISQNIGNPHISDNSENFESINKSFENNISNLRVETSLKNPQSLKDDVIQDINRLFPNSESLSMESLNASILSTRKQIVLLDRSLHKDTRNQISGMSDHLSLKDQISDARTLISLLIQNIGSIKEKAITSENMVEQITNEIRSLDNAKKNLTKTITTLRKYYMLGEAVENLRQLSLKPNPASYQRISQLLSAVNDLIIEFPQQQFCNIPSISRIHQSIETIKTSLYTSLEVSFKKFFSDYLYEERAPPTEDSQIQLNHACGIISNISEISKENIIKIFVQYNLQIYFSVFSGSSARLDNINTRYSWFKKRLGLYKIRFGKIFPDDWNIRQILAEKFCIQISEQIHSLLLSYQKNSIDAQVLHKAILSTIKFERDLQNKFQSQSNVEIELYIQQEEKDLEKLRQEAKMLPKNADSITIKYKILQKEKFIEELKNENKFQKMNNFSSDSDKRKSAKKNNISFNDIISYKFQDYMDIYIDFEDKSMTKKLQLILERETWSPESDFNSAQDLFIYISESLRNCTAFSKGKVFFDIVHKVWKKHIQSYSDSLIQKLPKLKLHSNSSKFNFLKDDSSSTAILNAHQLEIICHIIKMADYCREELEQTKSVVISTIEENFKGKITFSDEERKFYTVLKSSIEVIIISLLNSIDSSLQSMIKTPKENQRSNSEESDFLKEAVDILRKEFPRIAINIPSEHYPMLCDNFMISLMDVLIEYILKCKKLSMENVHQLLKDVRKLKTFLRELYEIHPQYSELYDEDDLDVLNRRVNRSATHVELLLNFLLMHPEESKLVDNYISVMREFGNKKELSKILEIFGISKQDRSILIGAYEEIVKVTPQNSI